MGLKVNYQLLPIKAHMFLFFAGTSPIIPFLPVFAKQLGFDQVSVAIVFGVLPFMGMLAKPIAGWIADRFGVERMVFYISIILTGIFYFALLLVNKIDSDTTATLQCTETTTVLKICRDEVSRNLALESMITSCPERCQLTCHLAEETQMDQICTALDYKHKGCYNGTTPEDLESLTMTIYSDLSKHDTQPTADCIYLPVDRIVIEEEERKAMICREFTEVLCSTNCYSEPLQKFVIKDSVMASPNFWMFFIFNIIAYSAFSVNCSIGDAICFQLLEDKPGNYGRQRVFGSIGWGGFTILAGYIIDFYSQHLNGEKDYTPALFLMLGLLTFDLIICVLKLRVKPTTKNSSGSIDVMRLLSSPSTVVFILWCTGVGVLTSLIWQETNSEQ